MPTVYLLHFNEPYPNGHRPQHYLGVAANLDERVAEHRSGSSKGRLTKALHEKGIGFIVARTWERKSSFGAFDLERRLKRSRRHRKLCPECNPTLKGKTA